MGDQSLVIKINGDTDGFNKSLGEADKGVKKLDSNLTSIATVSTAAYAALNAAIAALVIGYRDGEQAAFQTEQIIKSTARSALITSDEIGKLSLKWQGLTTFYSDNIRAGQNVLLSFRNIKGGSDRVTESMLDLSAFMKTDLQSSAKVLGRALDNPIVGLTALSKIGIIFGESQKKQIKTMMAFSNVAGAQGVILKALEGRIGGLAKASTKGTGAFIQLHNTFMNISDQLGEELAPSLIKAAKSLNKLLTYVRDHKEFATLAAKVITVSSAIAGTFMVLSLGSLAWIKYAAAVKLATVATAGLAFTMKGFLITSGIGILLVVIGDLALNWDKRLSQMTLAWNIFTKNMKETGEGLGVFITGIFTLDMAKIKKGYDLLKKTAFKSWEELKAGSLAINKKMEEELANESEAQRNARLEKERQDTIEHKKRMAEDAKNLLLTMQEEELGIKLNADDMESERLALIEEVRKNKEIEQLSASILLEKDHRAKLLLINERADKIALAKAKITGKARIEEEKRVQAIKYQMVLTTTDGMVQLGNALVERGGSNAKKAFLISKGLALASIAMNTAVAVMMAAGQTGIGAAATTPWLLGLGAIQAATVAATAYVQYTGMRKGGLLEGGIANQDSIPIMGQRGELMSPKQNFDEVIGSVRAKREADKIAPSTSSELHPNREDDTETKGPIEFIIGFADNAFKLIEENRQEQIALGTLRV